jgi:hypothetical protein
VAQGDFLISLLKLDQGRKQRIGDARKRGWHIPSVYLKFIHADNRLYWRNVILQVMLLISGTDLGFRWGMDAKLWNAPAALDWR